MNQQEQVHPLELQQKAVVQEFNLSKFVGQVALGVTVSLAVRYLLGKWDKFTARRNKN